MQKNTTYVLTMPCVCCPFVFFISTCDPKAQVLKSSRTALDLQAQNQSSTGNTLPHLELSVSINAQNTGCKPSPPRSQKPLTGAGVKLAVTTTGGSL